MGEKGNVARGAGGITETFETGVDTVTGIATGTISGVATGVMKDKVDDKIKKDDNPNG